MSSNFPLAPESFNSRAAAEYFQAKVGYTMGISLLNNKITAGDSDFQVIDVRSKEFYIAGHIPGAIWGDGDEIETALQKFSKEKVNIVYCYGELCLRGARICLAAAKAGFPVMELLGNYDGWADGYGFSIESGELL